MPGTSILVPTDFSLTAQKALDTAISLAALHGLRIELFHLLILPIDWTRLPKEKEAQYPELKAKIAQANQALMQAEAKVRASGVEVKSCLAFESSMNRFFAHVQQHQPRWIVMGSEGKDGLGDWLLGSNAQRVLRQSKVPVLMVKRQTPLPFRLNNLLFASNFDASALKAFQSVLPLIEKKQNLNPIQLLYINTPQRFEESWKTLPRMYQFIDQFPRYKFQPHIYNAFDEAQGICHFAYNYQMDLICLGTHGKDSFTQILSPSLAEEVANQAQGSVLTLPLT